MQGQPDDDGPGQDPDIVGFKQGVDRIIHDIHHECVQDLGDTAGWIEFGIADGKLQRDREEKGKADSDERGGERTDDVKGDNRLHFCVSAGFALDHGVHDENKDKDRCYTFQGTDEEIAKDADKRHSGRNKHCE